MTSTWYPPLVDLQGLRREDAFDEAERLERRRPPPCEVVLLLARLDFMDADG